ncbi:hypothetical protein CQA49_01870 [Helicobacter sp. MIT 00-7814]|uniref:class I SAM-dependent methyltransferase n=1 Tax=unclassified Helicobacter TaxID=2593540 RepID=UPI000E1FA62E|nr:MULTISPECIES: class I SAM-dependent methyltransferase [unclassified Helicobacter]RDU56153.1 hypothetical protein CQA37_02315 [Helicobacter sp. MIT 99-10781]RDU56250.1 hypothetical protein CQA49_01870 [Helicobacter sp. MIT 00-7814]
MNTNPTYTDFYTYRSKENALLIFQQRLKDAKIVFEKFHESFMQRNCPICGSNEFSSLPKFLGYYEMSLCAICHSEYVNPAPNPQALSFYYNHCENNKTYALLNSKQKASAKIDSRVNFIAEYIEKILQKQDCCNILEIGCNSGVFIYALSEYLQQIGKKNVNYYGIDIDENAITLAQDSLKEQIGGGAIFKR